MLCTIDKLCSISISLKLICKLKYTNDFLNDGIIRSTLMGDQ